MIQITMDVLCVEHDGLLVSERRAPRVIVRRYSPLPIIVHPSLSPSAGDATGEKARGQSEES